MNNELRYYGNPMNWEGVKGDLISRDALKEVIKANHYLLSAKNNSTDYGMFTTGIMQAIDNAPKVEAYTEEQIKELIKLNEEQVKELIELNKGEWINTSPYDDKGECSLCCYLSKKYYNFCPNCGSDNRRRSDNE